jgi:hypothetical protein
MPAAAAICDIVTAAKPFSWTSAAAEARATARSEDIHAERAGSLPRSGVNAATGRDVDHRHEPAVG